MLDSINLFILLLLVFDILLFSILYKIICCMIKNIFMYQIQKEIKQKKLFIMIY